MGTFIYLCSWAVNMARVNRAPMNTVRVVKSIVMQCFFSTWPVNMGRVNSMSVFMACVDGI